MKPVNPEPVAAPGPPRRRLAILTFVRIAAALLGMLIGGELLMRGRVRAWPFEAPLRKIPHLTSRDVNLRWRRRADGDPNSPESRNWQVDAKRAEAYRILLLGDSLVLFGETGAGKLYSQVVEANLCATALRRGPVEVINAGIPGYTTYQESEFLNVYGWAMEPDLVLLGFVFNDVYFKYLNRPTGARGLAVEPTVYLNRFDVSRFPGRCLARSYLAHEVVYVGTLLARVLSGQPIFPFERFPDLYLAWKPYGWDATDRLLRSMHAQLQQEGIPLVLVIFPMINQLDPQLLAADPGYVLYPQSRIRAICEAQQIPFLDLTASLRDHGGTNLFADYLHLNAAGNEVVAAEITQYLTARASTFGIREADPSP